MKIERYIGILAILGLFIVNVSWPAAALAIDQNTNCATFLQCSAPANTLSVPAGAGVPGTVCTTCVPASKAPAAAENQTPTSPTYLQCYAPVKAWNAPATSGEKKTSPPTVKRSESPWEVLGSILATPFVVGQCIVEGCP